MDDTDNKICEILKRDSRTSFVGIAKRLGISEGTVRNRVRAMAGSGIIEGFTIKRSYGAEGLVLVKSRKTGLREIINELNKFSDDVFEVAGEYDIACMISAGSLSELNRKIDRIRKIKGIASTVTAIKLH